MSGGCLRPNSSVVPSGLKSIAIDWSSDTGSLTALHVIKSAVAKRPSSETRSWNLPAITLTSGSSRLRTTSRKNAAFLARASTMVSRARGLAIFIGIAGEPPPEPMSNHVRLPSGTCSAATSGSTSKRSTASSLAFFALSWGPTPTTCSCARGAPPPLASRARLRSRRPQALRRSLRRSRRSSLRSSARLAGRR